MVEVSLKTQCRLSESVIAEGRAQYMKERGALSVDPYGISEGEVGPPSHSCGRTVCTLPGIDNGHASSWRTFFCPIISRS